MARKNVVVEPLAVIGMVEVELWEEGLKLGVGAIGSNGFG
jgi:hypothetical protein